MPLGELEVEGVVDRQIMRPGQRESDIEAGLVVGMDGQRCQGLQTLIDLVGGESVTTLRDQQSVADFQVPMSRDQRLGFFQTRQRRLGP